MSDLIERLREGVHGKSVALTDDVLQARLHEAADQLEAQQAEIARLREALAAIVDDSVSIDEAMRLSRAALEQRP